MTPLQDKERSSSVQMETHYLCPAGPLPLTLPHETSWCWLPCYLRPPAVCYATKDTALNYLMSSASIHVTLTGLLSHVWQLRLQLMTTLPMSLNQSDTTATQSNSGLTTNPTLKWSVSRSGGMFTYGKKGFWPSTGPIITGNDTKKSGQFIMLRVDLNR